MRRRKRSRRVRRRPGELWTLWRVHGREKATGKDRAIGYLVVSEEVSLRTPQPIAFVRGTGDGSLRAANYIRRHGALKLHPELCVAHRRRLIIDLHLRRYRAKRIRPLLGMLLFPVSVTGRRIANDKTFVAGNYTHALIGGRRVLCFQTMTHAGLELIKDKSGTPITSTRPSIAGEKAGKLAAAPSSIGSGMPAPMRLAV